MIGAPIALAKVCGPGQSEIDGGECIYPDNKTHEVAGARSNALCTAAFIERTDPQTVGGDPRIGRTAADADPLQMGTSKTRTIR